MFGSGKQYICNCYKPYTTSTLITCYAAHCRYIFRTMWSSHPSPPAHSIAQPGKQASNTVLLLLQSLHSLANKQATQSYYCYKACTAWQTSKQHSPTTAKMHAQLPLRSSTVCTLQEYRFPNGLKTFLLGCKFPN